ncbi:cytochrome c oxidase subunit 3 [Maribacter sp. HTCC2170]|uniref:cytochrome c oxidase subunit 3 n=1 Tax=Maribacter sp. (strain HTCC2170 / KCCM 42371) TaxID=313603 RepID=UPI00006B481C|nr:cytochrome c oxidase subunit 3 [Maribacter sp. HTCC2170]EAR01824.1 putative additional subunit of nitric oxide reductase (Nor) complex, membrane protein [Maribacter sp. HTCC2170]
MKSGAIDHKSIYYPPGGVLMWIIIFLELLTFGAALVAMVYYGRQEFEMFHNSRLQLNASIGTINTLFLISSGYFMARSVGYLKSNEKNRSLFFLKLTMFGGLLFLALKSVEYYFKIDAGLTVGHNTFFTFYWMLTLFHVIHVIVGLVILASVYFGLKKEISTVSIDDMEASAAFWHMCDLIWLLLFPVIYLLF